MGSRAGTLEGQLESHIRDLVAKYPSQRIPRVHDLARTFHTSTRAVSRVLHSLEEQGVVETRRRRGTYPAGARVSLEPGPSAKSSAQLVYDQVLRGIEQGRFPAGRQLPKIEFFTRTLHVSDHTVREALRLLERDRVVRRQRRGYVCGQGPRDADRIILSCQPDPGWWNRCHGNDWYAPFVRSFMAETSLTSTMVVPVFPGPDSDGLLIQGTKRIEEYVRAAGDRIAGTLVVGQGYDYWYNQQIRLADLVRQFGVSGKPVVWFDARDEVSMGREGRAEGLDVFAREPRLRNLFTRCHFSESGAIRYALDLLYHLGHRRVGIPRFVDDTDEFLLKRESLIASIAGEFRGMTVESYPTPMVLKVDMERELNPGANTPSQGRELTTLDRTEILPPGITAVLAVNDMRAKVLYAWLMKAGVETPRDASLISFDNYSHTLFPWQISSVDWGMGYLAYAAYHLITDEVSIPRRLCDVAGLPRVNHLGSVSKPARYQSR